MTKIETKFKMNQIIDAWQKLYVIEINMEM